jgi:hypothetical protein
LAQLQSHLFTIFTWIQGRYSITSLSSLSVSIHLRRVLSPFDHYEAFRKMAMDEGAWPNEAGFDTTYEEHEPVELIVKGTIPYYAAGVLCEPRHSTISN